MKKQASGLKKLLRVKDTDIDYSDIPEIKGFKGWQSNPHLKHFKPLKKSGFNLHE